VGADGLFVETIDSQDYTLQSASPGLVLDVAEEPRAESAAVFRDLEVELVQLQLASAGLLVAAEAESAIPLQNQLVDHAALRVAAELLHVVHLLEHVLDLLVRDDRGVMSPPDAPGKGGDR